MCRSISFRELERSIYIYNEEPWAISGLLRFSERFMAVQKCRKLSGNCGMSSRYWPRFDPRARGTLTRNYIFFFFRSRVYLYSVCGVERIRYIHR